jgi:general secretion pathway protein M
MKLAIDRYLARYPALAAGVYLMALIGLCFSALLVLLNTYESYQSRDRSSEKLSRIRDRIQLSTRSDHLTGDAWPSGSPFLEGQTVTIAGASLLQRITEAIVKAGGSVESSEISAQEEPSKNGYLKGVAVFEIEQPALQTFLYDIEAGTPFLFVDELVVTAPSTNNLGRTRVLVQVSGRWWDAN